MIAGQKILAQKSQQLSQGQFPIQQVQITAPPQLQAQREESIKPQIAEKVEGFEIPSCRPKAKMETESHEKVIAPLTYPLIPKSPAKDEPVFAYAKIFWDAANNKYIYELVEPQMSEKLKDTNIKVKEMLEQRLDVDFSKLKKIEVKKYLNDNVDKVLNYFNLILNDAEKTILKYYIERDFTALGIMEPLMQDPNIEDISCDGVNIPVFVFHRNSKVSSVATNIKFDTDEELDSFVIRLAQLCGKSISVAQPLLDGSLPDGSRVQATLGTDIARRGSNFTIRKFTEEPLTPTNILNYGTSDPGMLAYLWYAVDYGRSILVSGGTASGKTSMLNVLSLFIRPDKKIVSIEDTAELRLPHPHWVPMVARTSISVEGSKEVDLFELLKESLRQRPDNIIVGEVRGKEAYVLFQQMATGHPSLATIHAENIGRLMDRLTTQPISLPASLLSSLDIVVFQAKMRYRDKFVRRVVEIVEIVGVDPKTNLPIINQVYKWNPLKDTFDITSKSLVLKKISEYNGLTEKQIRDDIQKRIKILEWMDENKILDYRMFHKLFSIYYSDPNRLMSAVGAV